MTELAQRAVACKGWRWMPGMLTATGYRVCDSYRTWPHLQRGDTLRSGLHFPDLTDPATVGCLLALVREAWEPHRGSDYIASTMHTGSGWGVGARSSWVGVLPTYDTEAEALVAALEAADASV